MQRASFLYVTYLNIHFAQVGLSLLFETFGTGKSILGCSMGD